MLIVYAGSVKPHRSLCFRNLTYLTVHTHQHTHPIFDNENQTEPRSIKHGKDAEGHLVSSASGHTGIT